MKAALRCYPSLTLLLLACKDVSIMVPSLGSYHDAPVLPQAQEQQIKLATNMNFWNYEPE